MGRLEVLRRERELIMQKLATGENRAKCLIALMDIDEEIEEITEPKRTKLFKRKID